LILLALAKNPYPDADEIRELRIGVDVHLHDTVAHSSGDFLLGGSRATVEDKVPERLYELKILSQKKDRAHRGLEPFGCFNCSAT
jgi:hypothetical protein